MSIDIHPTALVDPRAELGDGCRIGPCCVVGPKACIGAGTVLQSHVIVDGNIVLGDNCEVFPFSCLGKKTQDLKYSGGEGPVRIGSGTTIREYVTVHMPTNPDGLTRIGDACAILAYCHIAHDCLLGNRIVMSNATSLAGHVVVEDRVVFGGMCGVHQFVRIGTMAMIGATSKTAQDVAPYCLVDGNPAAAVSINKIGLKRSGMSDALIQQINMAYKIIFRSGLPLETALARLQDEFSGIAEIEHMADFIRGSERGLARPKAKKERRHD
jgi:UDP-N-acetylglucosamine acyltransferase